jgi:hypothetical protein
LAPRAAQQSCFSLRRSVFDDDWCKQPARAQTSPRRTSTQILPHLTLSNISNILSGGKNKSENESEVLPRDRPAYPPVIDENDATWSKKYLHYHTEYSFRSAIDAGLCFALYGSHGRPLVENGEDIELSPENLLEFAELVHRKWVVDEEARNTPFCPSQEKFHTVVLRDVRHISEAP